jgi:hypothetical protein
MRSFNCHRCGGTINHARVSGSGRAPWYCRPCSKEKEVERMRARCEVDKARRRELRDPDCQECGSALVFDDSNPLRMDMHTICNACTHKRKLAEDARYRLKKGHKPTGTMGVSTASLSTGDYGSGTSRSGGIGAGRGRGSGRAGSRSLGGGGTYHAAEKPYRGEPVLGDEKAEPPFQTTPEEASRIGDAQKALREGLKGAQDTESRIQHGAGTENAGTSDAARDPAMAKAIDEAAHDPSKALASGLKGSACLRNERAWIADELQKDPSLRRYLAGTITHEQDPGHRAEVFESLANRLNMMRANGHPNLTLRQYLNSNPNFYGPIRRGEINENYLRRNVDPYRGPRGIDAEIDEVLAGSNRIRGMTDQGSRGDPNFGVGETIMSNREGYNDFGGRGGQGPAQRYRAEQQRNVAGEGPAQQDTTQPEQQRPQFNPSTGRFDAPPIRMSPDRTPEGPHMELSTLDPRLREIVGASGAQFEALHPGYKVEAFSGRRRGPKQGPHASEAGALDMQIRDPQGNVLLSRGDDPSGLYHELARIGKGEMLARHPDLAHRFNWGGAFPTGTDGRGPPDLMHFDLSGVRGRWQQNRIDNLDPLPGLKYGPQDEAAPLAAGRPQMPLSDPQEAVKQSPAAARPAAPEREAAAPREAPKPEPAPATKPEPPPKPEPASEPKPEPAKATATKDDK